MVRDGLLSEAPSEDHTQVGRRPVILRLRPESLIVAGVEITHSEAQIATADLNGRILRQRAIAWQPDHQVFLTRIRDATRVLTGSIRAGRLLGVGVSLPGTVDRVTGCVTAAENLGWFGVDAGRILSEGSPNSFYFENDARLCALAERWFCSLGGKPLDNFVFLTLRGGLGTGIVSEGNLIRGASGEASEFGHTSLFPDGRRCVCGAIGCWEEYASQRALERRYRELLGGLNQEPGPSADDIIRLARGGDATALEVLRETAVYLGMGFANLNAAFNPEAIIVGDYLASGWDLMENWVWDALRSRAPQRYLTRLRIFPSTLGRDSALKGALALVLSNYFTGSGTGNVKGIATHSTRSRHPR